MRNRSHRNLSLISLVILASACGDDVASPEAFTVRDSAGIQIVESSAPRLGADAWTVFEELVLQIGVLDGFEELTFERIDQVFLFSDGQIAASNKGTSVVGPGTRCFLPARFLPIDRQPESSK